MRARRQGHEIIVDVGFRTTRAPDWASNPNDGATQIPGSPVDEDMQGKVGDNQNKVATEGQ